MHARGPGPVRRGPGRRGAWRAWAVDPRAIEEPHGLPHRPWCRDLRRVLDATVRPRHAGLATSGAGDSLIALSGCDGLVDGGAWVDFAADVDEVGISAQTLMRLKEPFDVSTSTATQHLLPQRGWPGALGHRRPHLYRARLSARGCASPVSSPASTDAQAFYSPKLGGRHTAPPRSARGPRTTAAAPQS